MTRDYVERSECDAGLEGVPTRSYRVKSSMSGQTTGISSTKKPRLSKAYVQAYKWSHTELQKAVRAKKKQGGTSVCYPASVGRVSTITDPLFRERDFISTPMRQNNVWALSRSPMSAPLPEISSPPMRRNQRDAFTTPTREKISINRLRHRHLPCCISRYWSIVTILFLTTLIALCEHANHILLQTGLLSDLGLQFTCFFVKAACQAVIVVYFLSKLQWERESASKERRRWGFHDFMHCHGETMMSVEKLRSWFGEDAVFDPTFLTKWVTEEREYWQYRGD